MVEQQTRAGARPTRRRRRRRRRGSRRASSCFEPADEAAAVAGDRAPARRLDDRRVRRLGRRVDRPERAAVAGEQSVGLGVQARERQVGRALPRRRQRLGQVVLLGEQVVGPVAAAPRLDEHDLGRRRQHVGEQLVSVVATSHGSQLSMPSNRAPSASRSHCSRPHGSRATSARRPGAHLVGRDQLAGREDQRLGEVGGGALVVDAERGEAVDLVAPQVDADRRVAGRREHVDDRAAPGELAAVLDQLLAAVAEVDEPAHELVGIDRRRPGARRSARRRAHRGRGAAAGPGRRRR